MRTLDMPSNGRRAARRGETAPPSGVEGRLSLLQGKRHEARLIAGLNLHQNLDGVLVLVGLGTIHRLLDASSDIRRVRDRDTGNLKNDVAGLQPLVGGIALRVDLSDHDALVASARKLRRRREREAKILHLLARGVGLVFLERGKLLAGREGAELHVDLALLAVADDGKLDVGVRVQLGDLARQVAGVVDLLAVHGNDDVAGLKILLGRRAILGHLGDHRALSLGHADRLSDVVAHILDHDAKPAAIDTAMLLQLPDYLLDKGRGNVKCNANTAAGGREDRGIHAYDLAIQIE